MSTEDDKELRSELGKFIDLRDVPEDQCVPIYGDFTPGPPRVTTVPVYGVPMPQDRPERSFHVVIREPVCAKCNNKMDALLLRDYEKADKIPVFYCGCCKKVHMVSRPEFLNWMACTGLSGSNMCYVADVEEGKVYRV